MKNKKIYLAYGSNMNLPQMAHRCPNAEVLGSAMLEDYRLLFRSVATVEPCVGMSVPVVLWAITPSDEANLDAYEGFPRLYRKETVSVELDGETVKAMVYIMNPVYAVGSPSEGYYRTIIDGYRSAGFSKKALDEAVQFSAEYKAASPSKNENKYRRIIIADAQSKPQN